MSSDDPFASPQAGLEPEASVDPADEAKRRLMLRTTIEGESVPV